MADVLVVTAIIVFVVAMLGLLWGPGADMTLTQAVPLVLSIAVFIYLGLALFKAEWF